VTSGQGECVLEPRRKAILVLNSLIAHRGDRGGFQ